MHIREQHNSVDVERQCCVNPDTSMTKELKRIWQICFGDEPEYIDFYFEYRFRPEEMLVYLIDGHPVSMLSLLPAKLYYGGKMQSLRYVYGVGTLPEHRGRGYARILLEEGRRRTGEPLALVPALDSLWEYYGKLGFAPVFWLAEYHIEPEEIAACGSERDGQEYWLLTVTPGEYYRIREAAFAADGYVSWDEDAIAYTLRENDFVGGYAYKVQHHGREDILMMRQEEQALHILETTLSPADVTAVMKRLRINCPVLVRGAVDRISAEAAPDGDSYAVRDYGMLWGGPEICGGYVNLTLE